MDVTVRTLKGRAVSLGKALFAAAILLATSGPSSRPNPNLEKAFPISAASIAVIPLHVFYVATHPDFCARFGGFRC